MAEPAIPVVPAADAGLPRRRFLRMPALALLLLTWAIHWRTFGTSELGRDGFLAVDLGVSPLSQMAGFLLRDVHPPLFYAALHGWFGLVGATYTTAKFAPIAAAMLALAAVSRLGEVLVGAVWALLAAGLLVVSPAVMVLSPTVRDFSPGLSLSLLTLLLALLVIRRDAQGRPARLGQLALALGTAAGLLTWYFHWCFLATEAVVLTVAAGPFPGPAPSSQRITLAGRVQRLWPLLLGTLISAPWYVAFVPQVLGHLRAGVTAVGAVPRVVSRGEELTILTQAIVGRDADWLALLASAGWCIALVIGTGGCLRRRAPSTNDPHRYSAGDRLGRWMLLMGLLFASASITIAILHWAQPVSLPKYILAVVPFAVLLQSMAIRRPPLGLRMVAIGGLALAVLVQTSSAWRLATSGSIDWTHDAVAAALAPRLEPGDVVVFSDHAQRGQYLLARSWSGASVGRTAVIQATNAEESYLHDTRQEARQVVAALLPGTKRVWYVEAGEPAAGPHPGQAALAALTFPISRQQLGDADLQLSGVAVPDVHLAPKATLGGVATLLAADITSRARPGGLVAVRLLWRDDRLIPGFYTVFVHLDNAAGRSVAQHDGVPMAGLRPTDTWRTGEQIDDRHGLALPPDLPLGDYVLNAGLYLGQQQLAMPDGTNAIPLGRVHIAD